MTPFVRPDLELPPVWDGRNIALLHQLCIAFGTEDRRMREFEKSFVLSSHSKAESPANASLFWNVDAVTDESAGARRVWLC